MQLINQKNLKKKRKDNKNYWKRGNAESGSNGMQMMKNKAFRSRRPARILFQGKLQTNTF